MDAAEDFHVDFKEERCCMLVLKRKVGESIEIGHDGEIVITVVEVTHKVVRLGLAAQPTVPIKRFSTKPMSIGEFSHVVEDSPQAS